MITISDIYHQVQFKNEKSHNELLKTINATVNHEIRNPVNSIVAFNLQDESLYLQLETVINDCHNISDLTKRRFSHILTKLKKGNSV